jgi:hypothetical protein
MGSVKRSDRQGGRVGVEMGVGRDAGRLVLALGERWRWVRATQSARWAAVIFLGVVGVLKGTRENCALSWRYACDFGDGRDGWGCFSLS